MSIRKKFALVAVGICLWGMGCAGARGPSPQEISRQLEQARQYAAQEAKVARISPYYPSNLEFVPPNFSSQYGFEVQFYGEGIGMRDRGDTLTGRYSSENRPGSASTFFSASARYRSGTTLTCQGEAFRDKIYSFQAMRSTPGENAETTNDPNSSLGQTMLQICGRAASFARAFMKNNGYRLFEFNPRIGY